MGVRGRAVLVGCFVGVAALGAGVGYAALAGSTAETPTPPQQRTGCGDVRQTRGKETVIKGTERTETICGTPGKDLIYPEGGNDKIWGKEGDDRIWAKNNRPDLVSGGGGKDWAELDSCDTAGGVEKMVRARNKCRGVKPAGSSSLGTKAVDYYALSYQAVIECHSRDFATNGFQMRIAEEPTILAVNTTRQPDWQFVTWIPLLYRWTGTEWQQIVVRNAFWLWDWTIDEQDEEFFQLRNFWRKVGGTRVRTGFVNLNADTRYQMRMQIRWYKTKRTPNASIEALGGSHFGPYETDHVHESCTFPLAPPPAPAARAAKKAAPGPVTQIRLG